MEIISRQEAKEKGLLFYFTGKPCKRGGIAKRRLVNGYCQCDVCLSVKNSIDEKSRINNFQKNKDKLNKFKEDHWDEYTNLRRDYYLKNKEKIKQYRTRYELKNPEKASGWRGKRMSIKANASVRWSGELTEFVVFEANKLRNLRKKTTGFKWSIDHMIPLINKDVCGLDVWNNIQVIPLCINTHKRSKLIYTKNQEWWNDFDKFFNHSSNNLG